MTVLKVSFVDSNVCHSDKWVDIPELVPSSRGLFPKPAPVDGAQGGSDAVMWTAMGPWLPSSCSSRLDSQNSKPMEEQFEGSLLVNLR